MTCQRSKRKIQSTYLRFHRIQIRGIFQLFYSLLVLTHHSTDSVVCSTPVSIFSTHDISGRKIRSSSDSEKLIIEMRSFEQVQGSDHPSFRHIYHFSSLK